jgi:hypothetical protein
VLPEENSKIPFQSLNLKVMRREVGIPFHERNQAVTVCGLRYLICVSGGGQLQNTQTDRHTHTQQSKRNSVIDRDIKIYSARELWENSYASNLKETYLESPANEW